VSIALRLPLCSESDLSIGLVGLSLGPQDPRSPPANYGTYRVKNKKSRCWSQLILSRYFLAWAIQLFHS